MAKQNPTLSDILDRDVEKLRDTAFPVKSSLLRRLLVRRYPCAKLHPNPDDEFCDPAIGPSNRIIQEYAQKIRRAMDNSFPGKIQIVRIYPQGYMILNGHHRWAAALQTGLKKIPVKLINPTSETEIRRMLKEVKNDKRVSFDLDEVVFVEPGGASLPDMPLEDSLPGPYGHIYRQPLRKGIPLLFDYLEDHGYDVWVYSHKYYSREYLFRYFRRHKVHVRFFVTGVRRNSKLWSMIEEKYNTTLHIDTHLVVQVDKNTREFQDHELDESKDWAHAVIDVLKQMEENDA